MRVLLIDDDARLAELLVGYLGPQGVTMVHAPGGQAGLAQLAAGGFDAVLLDVMMPGLDGWSVAEELLDDPITEDIPIVFLTARAEVRDRARGLDLGGVDYVTKPFNPLELAPLVQALLDRVQRGEQDDLRREKLAELRLGLDRT